MAEIIAPVIRNGDTLSAATQDDFLDSIATQTAAQTIAADNIRRESIGITHVASDFSTIFHGRADYSGSADYTVTSSQGVPNAASNTMEVTVSETITAGDVIRIRAGMLTNVPTVGAPTQDEYAFILRLQTSAGNIFPGPTYVYSMQAHKDSSFSVASVLNYTRPQIIWDYIYTGADVTLNTVDILASTRNASNSIPIESWHLYVCIMRR